jgi:hypothetical protein
MVKLFWVGIATGLVFTNLVYGFVGYDQYHFNETEEFFLLEAHEHESLYSSSLLEGNGNPLLVGLTLIHNAASKGAVCLDGTLPGYHLHRGYGSGANSWLVNLEVYHFILLFPFLL